MTVIGLGNALSDPLQSPAFRLWLALWVADMRDIKNGTLEEFRARYPTCECVSALSYIFFVREENRSVHILVSERMGILLIKEISIIVPTEHTHHEIRKAH